MNYYKRWSAWWGLILSMSWAVKNMATTWGIGRIDGYVLRRSWVAKIGLCQRDVIVLLGL